MGTEFLELLCEAGAWTAALQFKDARYSAETNTLTVNFYTIEDISTEQETELLALLQQRFSACNIELLMDKPVFAEVIAGKESDKKEKVLYGKKLSPKRIVSLADVREDMGTVIMEGHLLAKEKKERKHGGDKEWLIFTITDYANTFQCRLFLFQNEVKKLEDALAAVLKEQGWLRIRGACMYDKFTRDYNIRVTDITQIAARTREDTAEEKRVELHLHTKMSAMDAVVDVKKAIAMAARFGHKALAITDHGVVQAFPDAAKAGKANGVKILYGVEGYLKQDAEPISMEQTYVVFDVETTGLKATHGDIIEIGAVKLKNGEVLDRFSTFVHPSMPIPPNITAITGIDDDMVLDAPLAGEALAAFYAFVEGCVLVAHNAAFDVGFIREHGTRHAIAFTMPYVDTLMLSRYLFFGMPNHKLNTLCAHFGILLENHHRAVDDAEATAKLFLYMLERIKEKGIGAVPAVTQDFEQTQEKKNRAKYNHIILLARTQAGLKNLYRLVSHAHMDFFHSKPQIPKFLLSLFREGLLLGSACEQGELFQAIFRDAPQTEIDALADWYDYIEIQPIGNNDFMVRNETVKDENGLRALNKRVVDVAERMGKPVVATGDVHFLNPEESVFRAVIMNELGFSDALAQAPLYYRTTDEMLEEFQYLGDEKAKEVVVTTPNRIADLCDDLKPYPDGTHAPEFEKADETLRELAIGRAHTMYGEVLPPVVQARLDKELHSIIDNGFASLYIMAQMLVQKSLSDGYLVGSRGSVGSSFVATMAGITEVNPLAPHYLCPRCKHSDFDVDKAAYATGVDLPPAVCPQCGETYNQEGYDIPFEVFLGFDGDKIPDIDLNFSGEYQPVAHKFTEEMVGEGNAFRAGTISCVEEKTAYGYVMKYLETTGIVVGNQEIDRLRQGCSGVKRTTGQHPGGIVVLPRGRDILDFTPLQYPADKKQKNTITTHFDFHAMDDRLVKLDILGHDDPTALRMMQDLTGVDPRSIPLNDPDTLGLYASVEKMGIDLTALDGCDVGSLGLPEFGTPFVRRMLMDTRPTTMEELVRISGLSHGEDVWVNNAQTLVKDEVATLKEVICTRDDIMNYLIAKGCDPSISFKTMENVRKGKGITQEMEQAMHDGNVQDWFIDSCKKIKYMFPRAHAVAYVMMSFRVAYFKMYYPEVFYAVYYTVRADVFDIRFAMGEPEELLKNIRDILSAVKKRDDLSPPEKKKLTILEVIYEMKLRGIPMLPVDIYRSKATQFTIEEGGIRAPFSALAGVGDTAANDVVKKICANEKYCSIEDFQNKTGANSGMVKAMQEIGCFADMAETNQISLLDFL